ncbi:MAG: Trm112 family protein [Glaciecola sp.]|jgi:uncharacterized protein YbaR (Trm112 family)
MEKFDPRLLEVLACPLCKGTLRYVHTSTHQELVCRFDRLAFPIRGAVPVMLEEHARTLTTAELDQVP